MAYPDVVWTPDGKLPKVVPMTNIEIEVIYNTWANETVLLEVHHRRKMVCFGCGSRGTYDLNSSKQVGFKLPKCSRCNIRYCDGNRYVQ